MLIFMVVQLSGSAGTYPVELSPPFVAKIHDCCLHLHGRCIQEYDMRRGEHPPLRCPDGGPDRCLYRPYDPAVPAYGPPPE